MVHKKRDIVLICHNLRSCHNVGSLLRTAEGLGLSHVYFTGYTPYPLTNPDIRMPHIANKLHKQIQKTALGAETSQPWTQQQDIFTMIIELKAQGYTIAALEQTSRSVALPDWKAPQKIAVLVGREVEGLELEVVEACEVALEIPMSGKKESFNVVQAAAMAMYAFRYTNMIK